MATKKKKTFGKKIEEPNSELQSSNELVQPKKDPEVKIDIRIEDKELRHIPRKYHKFISK